MATNPLLSFTVFSSSSAPIRRHLLHTTHKASPNLKLLTSRVVQLTRRRQLKQIFEEIDTANLRYGKLNTIVMNAVLEGCVHCGDIDSALQIFHDMSKPQSCGVNGVTYSTLLKGLGEARRVDEAFQILDSIEKGTTAGSPKLQMTGVYINNGRKAREGESQWHNLISIPEIFSTNTLQTRLQMRKLETEHAVTV